MLEIKKISLTTREPILNNFSYRFQNRKIYQIVAENGTGKTSFLRAITNLISIDHGQILYDGLPYSKTKNRVFFYESNSWLNGNLNSLDYLKFVQKQWRSQVDLNKELNFLGIKEYAKVPIKKYSLGMKQKLMIAMYLISDAHYLLMDEITNGLDEKSRLKFYKRINEIVEKEEKCIILTSHYSDEIKIGNLCKLKLHNHTMNEVE